MAKEPQGGGAEPGSSRDDLSIDRPRLTPQGHASGTATGEDATDPSGKGARQGQGDKAEG